MRILISLTILFGLMIPVQAEKKLVIAVFDLMPKPKNRNTLKEAELVSELLRTAVINAKGEQDEVLALSHMKSVLKVHSLTMLGLVNEKKAAKMGKMLAANKILTGTLSKSGNEYVINGSIVDVEKGTAEFAHAEPLASISTSDITDGTNRFAKAIMKKMKGEYVEDDPGNVEMSKPAVTTDKSSYSPGEQISVNYVAPSNAGQDAWIGLIPAEVPHEGQVNNSDVLTFKYLKGKRKGVLMFQAPRRPGQYDLRLHTSEKGPEAAWVRINVN